MNVKVLSEHGYEEALLGISLSRNQPPENMSTVAFSLSSKEGGHNKFLESIYLWLDVTAPRFFWAEGDTYRLSTKQSESTMYTITKNSLTQDDFEYPIYQPTLTRLNEVIYYYHNNTDDDKLRESQFRFIKSNLPEGFLQRRIWVMNYKCLRNIYHQRKNHRLPQWHIFLDTIIPQIEHPEFIERE